MKKIVFLTVGMFAYALLSVHAQNTIMNTTFNDWTNWSSTGSGLTFQATNNVDLDGVTVNGIDNPSDAGGTSLGGSLEVSPIVPCNWGQAGPVFGGPGPTEAVLVAMDGPGAAYGSPLAAQSGTMYVDFTMPQYTNSGTYFSMGIFFQDDAQWGGWSASQNVDLGPVNTPYGIQEKYRAVIPYTLSPITTLTYAQLGFWIFTDYQGSNAWYIDNISVAPLPTTVIPAPVYPLFNTYEDFTNWSSAGGDLILATNGWSVDDNTTNGLGNTSAPGATDGTSGSLLLYWSSVETGYGTIAAGPNEDANAGFMQAIDPGCDPGTQTSVAAYGYIYMDFSQPDNTDGGTYFQLGVNLAYDANGYYGVVTSSSTTDLHIQDDSGYEVYRATIPYTINAGHYYGFTPSIFVNSNYQPTNGFHVDNITVSAAQAPLITSVALNGTDFVLNGTNGLTGYKFSLLSSTNLAQQLSQWKVEEAGIPFNGPTYTITNTVDPAGTHKFYTIKVLP
jgi:hypothetical protein